MSDDTIDVGSQMVDKSELLDQHQASDSLDDRGVADLLDEGIVTGERWSPGQGFGNTHAEELRGETLEQRMAQEEPEPDPRDWDDDDLGDHEVGRDRAGRLVAPDEGAHQDDEAAAIAFDVGIDGAGASAEEAAMHVIPDDEY